MLTILNYSVVILWINRVVLTQNNRIILQGFFELGN